MTLISDLRASLAAVKGPPPRLLTLEDLPTDEQLAVTHAQLDILLWSYQGKNR